MNDYIVKEEIKKEIKEFLQIQWKWMQNIFKRMGHNESRAKRKVYNTSAFIKNLERLYSSNLEAHLRIRTKRSKYQEE